jgi:6-phosphogluconolactonase
VAKIRLREFRSPEDLTVAVAVLLEQQLAREFGKGHAVMLAGGGTPLPAYQEVIRRRVHAADDAFVCFSDERFVPEGMPDSNYGRIKPMLDSIGMQEERVMRVHVQGGLKEAASRYDRDLKQFFKSGGRLTLGLLGLGEDGHTASLFSQADVQAGKGAYAVPVVRKEKPDRISVTPDLLKRVETLIFLAVGSEKKAIIKRLLDEPDCVPAGMAVRDAQSVQLWVA